MGFSADSDEAVATGPAPDRIARRPTRRPSRLRPRTVMFSIVLSPGDEPEPTNQAPTAEFTADCSGLTCEFDASGSSDPDDDKLTYSWDLRRRPGTELRSPPEHTYASDGQRTVTLTVSDGTESDEATRQVNPVADIAQGTVSFVAAASTVG